LLAMGIGRHTGNGHQKMGWNGFLGVDEQILIRWGIFLFSIFCFLLDITDTIDENPFFSVSFISVVVGFLILSA